MCVCRDFCEYAGKDMIYQNDSNPIAKTSHFQIINGKMGYEENLLPELLMENIPLPGMDGVTKEVVFNNIKLMPIITQVKYLPFCPWPEIKLMLELYISMCNAIDPTFLTPHFIREEGGSLLAFNYQEYISPRKDIFLCRDYLIYELEILLVEKDNISPFTDDQVECLTKNVIDNELLIRHEMAVDTFAQKK